MSKRTSVSWALLALAMINVAAMVSPRNLPVMASTAGR